MKFNYFHSLTCLMVMVVFLTGHSKILLGADIHIVALLSMDAAPYQEALEGFQKHLHDQGLRTHYEVHTLRDQDPLPKSTLKAIRNNKTTLILTLGTSATEAALASGTKRPIVAGLIVNKDVLSKDANATGVVLEYPVETELKWLQYLLPETKKVGVIYNAKRNKDKVRQAKELFQDLKIDLEGQEVETPSEIPAALKNLSRRADVLWGIADDLVLNPKTAKQILLFSFRNQIPFVGLSPAWVKAGALYSLDWDYRDMGMQCGALALEIVNGKEARALPLMHPRKTEYCVNRKTAKSIKVDLSEDVLKGAKIVF